MKRKIHVYHTNMDETLVRAEWKPVTRVWRKKAGPPSIQETIAMRGDSFTACPHPEVTTQYQVKSVLADKQSTQYPIHDMSRSAYEQQIKSQQMTEWGPSATSESIRE